MKLWQKPPKELKRTKVAKVWKKRTERLLNGGSERKAHRKVYERDQNCCICHNFVPIPEWAELPPVWCFAHILSKLMYPALRLFVNNFALVCGTDCHAKVDKKLAGKNKAEIEKIILSGKKVNIWDL